MFWGRMNWSHRSKLTTLLTLTVSLALAGVFVFVALVVREQALNRRFVELEHNVRTVAKEWEGSASLGDADDFPDTEVAVYRHDGTVTASTTRNPPARVVGRLKTNDRIFFGFSSGNAVFVGVSSWAETEAGLRQLALILAALWLPLTLLTAAASWYGGGLVLRPVTELVESAEQLSIKADGQSLTTSDTAEFATLANSLNHLIARVRHAASLQEQFASDAAHELRNPLAILRTRIETNLRRERSVEEHVASQQAMLAQIENLTAIVETLLSSARQVVSEAPLLRLDESIQKAMEHWISLRDYDEKRIRLVSAPCDARLTQEEIQIVVANLLDNAARHTPAGETIEMEVAQLNGSALLSVRDFGPGLSPKEAELAFDRFYRSDEGRNRVHGGAGIGLSVVKRIIEARGGTIGFVEVPEGALVRVSLPSGHEG